MADTALLLSDLGGGTATTGSSNAYLLTLPTAPTAYADNLAFSATASFSNTGAATMDVNTLGVKDIKKILAGSATALAPGDWPAGHIGDFTYSSANNAFILKNPATVPISRIADLGSGVGTFLGTPSSANLAAALTDETGSGAAVFATSPTLVTPNLGTPSAATLTNATGLPISTGVSGLGTGVATFLATPSSANLASAVTGETGSGALVFATSPALTTPDLGTPSAATLTNATGLPVASGISGLGSGVATFLATPSSANLAAAVTDELGAAGSLLFSGVIDTDTTMAANSDTKLASQKATKAYVDASAAGINWAANGSVGNATTANVTLSGEQTIDGVLTSTSRILVKNQTSATENGIYVTAAGAWSRATDADAGAEFVRLGVFVSAGTTQAGTTWVCTRTTAPTLGSDNITFVQNGASQVYSAGTGLGLSLNTFSITDAELLALAGLTSAADKLPYFTGSGTAAVADFTSAGRALMDDASASAQRTTLGVGTGDSPQFTAINVGDASDTTLARAAAGRLTVEGSGLVRGPATPTDNAVVRFDGTTGDLTQNSGVIIDDSNNVSGVASLTTTGAIELGAASDTTIARSSAGNVTIEGNLIYRAGGTDVPVADGGTGASTAAAAATNLGLGTGDSPQFAAVNVGAATDTTLARAAAGRLSVEGVGLVRGPASSTNTAIARFSGVTGDLLQDSGVTVDGSNNISGVANLTTTGVVEIGDSADTTLARAAAGRLSVESVAIMRGPASATDNALPRFDATTGDLLQASSVLVDDSNNVTGVLNLTQTSTDAGAATAPSHILDRNSASPATSDVLGQLVFRGRNSTPATRDYGLITALIDDPTAASEDGHLETYVYVAGTQTLAASTGAGMAIGNPTGGRKGTGSLNAQSLYLNGSQIASGTYTPTITNGTNVDSSSSASAFYMRMQDVVWVRGSVSVDTTTDSLDTVIGISLPVSSNLAATNDLIGAIAGLGHGSVLADTVNDRATATFIATGTTARTYYFDFAFKVL